jgi:hypothetical protein
MNQPLGKSFAYSTQTKFNRRSFLKAILVSGADPWLFLPWHTPHATPEAMDSRWPNWLQTITGQREAVMHFGRAYVATAGAEQDADRLLSLIDASITNLPQRTTAQHQDPTLVADLLRRVVQQDYAQNRVILLQGWVLSLTEARLYGLVWVLSDH